MLEGAGLLLTGAKALAKAGNQRAVPKQHGGKQARTAPGGVRVLRWQLSVQGGLLLPPRSMCRATAGTGM